MLKKLKQFRESLSDEQKTMLHSAFTEDIVQRLFSSEEEKTADVLVVDLNKYLAARPMVAFDLYKKLTTEQQAMISDLVFDDEDDE